MNKRNILFSILGILFFISFAFAGNAAEDIPLVITNAGFEEASANALPAQWQIDATAPGTQIQIDTQSAHTGKSSLTIANAAPALVTLSSAPVTLTVGHLYKLRGWIKTENLYSDPTSRYPTAVPACLTMASFPFTNHSSTAGATSDWTKAETFFIATQSADRVRVHFGYNGTSTGKAWFDDVSVEEVTNIEEFIPPDTVRWFNSAYRFEDKGWIFVHIEGEPYQRGYQHGYLLGSEIIAYMEKLANRQNEGNSVKGWDDLRLIANSYFLRKFDEEFLIEMKGIADGTVKIGVKFHDRSLDYIDIVTLNSVVDIGQLAEGISRTPSGLTGKNFLKAEDELLIPDNLHKCSGFVATGPATSNGRFVFGQIFMWAGYTGVHWNIIMDIAPTKGHRLVYQTFPGGIHSASDFYLNSAGIVIGETTVMQTPFNDQGTPQSNRIRKAAQYASSIDDVVRILKEKNNGLYTNDWPIADAKTNEVAMFLLGTNASKLWRSNSKEFPGGTEGFFWTNNNAKDMDVRKEYVTTPGNSPFDIIFNPWNRDLQFYDFYQKNKGKIDANAGVNLWASSPMNRSHACDGKITTGEMADKMVFLAHYGKVTLREKFPGPNPRIMPEFPGAIPHLTLGYSTASPPFITDKLKEQHAKNPATQKEDAPGKPANDFGAASSTIAFDKRALWWNTVYPASNADNWFVSGTAVYWNMLNSLPEDSTEAAVYLRNQLAELNYRFLYIVSRETEIPALKAERMYDRYDNYLIPRIKGVFALHQLRLLAGNELFSKIMNAVHDKFAKKPMTTEQFILTVSKVSGKKLNDFMMQWLDRTGLPAVEPAITATQNGNEWKVQLEVKQSEPLYDFFTLVSINTGKTVYWKPIHVTRAQETFDFTVPEKPTRIVFNAGNDIPVKQSNFYVFSNIIDDFHHALIVYGTSRQIEANHTMALRLQTTLADAYTEILIPVKKDCEVTAEELGSYDLIIVGHPADNSLLARIIEKLPPFITFERNMFRFNNKTYADSDDGIILTVANPFNPKKALYLVIANSALELYQMTKKYQSMPAWVLFKGDKLVDKGYHTAFEFTY